MSVIKFQSTLQYFSQKEFKSFTCSLYGRLKAKSCKPGEGFFICEMKFVTETLADLYNELKKHSVYTYLLLNSLEYNPERKDDKKYIFVTLPRLFEHRN